jgi:hypothetical protein
MIAPIKEELLHYVWRTQRFDHTKLKTTDGRTLSIQQYGRLNADAGPDFLEARLTIGETVWVGQVEMHLRASDWIKHGHTGDKRYDNVILHVVYDHDCEINDPSGRPLPVLLLNDRIPPSTLRQYERLQATDKWIPCAGLTDTIPQDKWRLWLDSVIAERLSLKARAVHELTTHYRGDWASTTYHMLCRALGLKVNVDAMDALAYAMPLSILQKNADDRHHIEALLLGQAGILQAVEVHDDYSTALLTTYTHLSHKYQLAAIESSRWRYSKMRPTGFPDIRIVQLAAILKESTQLFQYIRENGVTAIKDLLSVAPDTYWDNHYRLGVASDRNQPKRLGIGTIHNILINAFAPVLMAYGESIDDYTACEQAIDLLYELPAENNKVLRNWEHLGVKASHGAHSQALLHLKKHYCDQQRCLSCSVGASIVS